MWDKKAGYLIRVAGLNEIEALFLSATTKAQIRKDVKDLLHLDRRIRFVWLCHWVRLEIDQDLEGDSSRILGSVAPVFLLCGIDPRPNTAVVCNFFSAMTYAAAKRCARERMYKEKNLYRCERIPYDRQIL